ncbi:MAG: dTDP-glucose 4,6-dehydratase [Magnetococcales bacterium]|nr:dTDP-glucose 4,6-dehydratase [Magnetococcales bacterium]
MGGILITGGAGFIGANFVHYWSRQHPQDRLVVLDALTYAGNRASLEGLPPGSDFRFVYGSINNLELVKRVLSEEGIDTIVHFAAESHVDRSILGPDAFIETNVVGTHVLLQAARAVWLQGPGGPLPHRFHHVSTDEVYGSLLPEDPPFTEENRYLPNSPYSASKAASDHLVRAAHHTYGLQVTTSNCSNNYGPFQFPEKLLPLMIVNILENRPLPVYGDGLNVRDWLYVEDHCRGIERILRQGRVGEVYNIGGNAEWQNIDIVRLLCRELDQAFAADPGLVRRYPRAQLAARQESAGLITFVADRPGHDRRYAIDARKIRSELGFEPQESFASGIRKTIAWYLEDEAWWRPLQSAATSRVR